MPARVPVTFVPAELTVWVSPGTLVVDAAREAGIIVPAPCGGRGICGSCGVKVLEGELAPPDEDERRGLARAPQGVRLACRARVAGPVSIRPLIAHVRPSIVAGVREKANVVAGVDLGTTNVAAVVVDLDSGRELARGSAPNAQQSMGADILTRLSAAAAGERERLAELARDSVRDALALAVTRSGVEPERLRRVAIGANTAMAALLAGVDTAPLAVHPFEAPKLPGTLPLSDLKSLVASDADVVLIPPIASFVGGDALAGLVAGGVCDATTPELLVDIGTNAEILLTGVKTMLVASAAAGPAFEGGGIACGGPAAPGAIERVRVHDDGSLELTVIGGGAPGWLSGAGLVSAVAELVRRGGVRSDGLMQPGGALRSRFRTGEDGVVEVVLDDAGDVVLTQLDVRALQIAKAAVQAGIERVLAAAGSEAAALDEIRVAGAFGGALDPADLVELGVVPARFGSRVRKAGNTALEGAAMVALDPTILECALKEARGAVHVDLASDPGFARSLLAATELRPA